MQAVDLIGLLVPVTYLFMLATETAWPARRFPARPGWRWIGIAFLVLVGTVSTVVPLLVPADWLAAHRWLEGTRLGIVGGTLAGWVVLSGLAFAWHRLCTRGRRSGAPGTSCTTARSASTSAARRCSIRSKWSCRR